METPGSTTKVFTVTAEAAGSMGGTRRRRKRTTGKNETMKVGKEGHKGGAAAIAPATAAPAVPPAPVKTNLPPPPPKNMQKGGTSPGTSLQIEANRAPGGAEPPPAQFKNSTATALAATTTDSSPAPVKAQTQAGGVKVILEKKKNTRVVLTPTKVKKLIHTVPAKTRKVAKKIRMSLNAFGKRVTIANTIRSEAKKNTIGDVKKTLVEARLIKETSKAPEGVLRQMYSDYMMLKNRAL